MKLKVYLFLGGGAVLALYLGAVGMIVTTHALRSVRAEVRRRLTRLHP